jgi:hypothetical protein
MSPIVISAAIAFLVISQQQLRANRRNEAEARARASQTALQPTVPAPSTPNVPGVLLPQSADAGEAMRQLQGALHQWAVLATRFVPPRRQPLPALVIDGVFDPITAQYLVHFQTTARKILERMNISDVRAYGSGRVSSDILAQAAALLTPCYLAGDRRSRSRRFMICLTPEQLLASSQRSPQLWSQATVGEMAYMLTALLQEIARRQA